MTLINHQQKKIGNKAIVIGSGISGLMVGRILSDYFENVVIVEREHFDLVGKISPRPGVPQGSQVHNLLLKGSSIIRKYFPDFDELIQKNGANKIDPLYDVRYFISEKWVPQLKSKYVKYLCTRPVTEVTLRMLLEKCDNVSFLYSSNVTELLTDRHKERIVGVIFLNKITNALETLYGDLIVDASGLASKCPRMLESLGYGTVPTTGFNVNVNYASRLYRYSEKLNFDFMELAIFYKPPQLKKLGGLFMIEDDEQGKRFIVTLAEMHTSDELIITDESFLQFTKSLARQDIYHFIKDADPITQPIPFRYQATRLYQYERYTTLPAGFIAIGDSICSFNPTLGQGMTVCALEADLLNYILLTHPDDFITYLKTHYFKQISALIKPVWQIGVSQDFSFNETQGKKSLNMLVNKRLQNLFLDACQDPYVWKKFFLVMNLEEPFYSLLQPKALSRVLFPK